MINLIVGTCIMLQGFTWKVRTKYHDDAKLSYPVIFRMLDNDKTTEMIVLYDSYWKLNFLEKNAELIKCPIGY